MRRRLTGTLRRRSTRGKEEFISQPFADGDSGAGESPPPPPAPVQMPEKAELNRIYKQLLEELAIPESKREQMMQTEDDARKWKLIQHHSAMIKLSKQDTTKETQKPAYWINVIQGRNARNEPSMTLGEASELQAVIRTSHKQFLSEFIELEGVQFLIELTRWYSNRHPRSQEEKEILPQIMTCFKALMNNQLGMDAVLLLEDSITIIALAMDLNDISDIRTTQEVIMLLAVTCFYSSMGRNLVVKAMDDLRIRYREAARFESLVSLFEETNDAEFRAAVTMFITTIVNSAASVDSRVRVRNDFLALDIMRVFERAVAEATEEDQASTVIATQFQVFEDMMVADHAEVIHSLFQSPQDDASSMDSMETDDQALDLSDQAQVIEVVRSNALRAGCPELLLEMFQTLLLVPAERTLAVPVWSGILQFVREATNFESGTHRTRSTKLNYSILHDLLDQRLALDRNFSQLTSSDEIINKQRQKIVELEKQLESGGKGGSGTGSGGGGAKGEELDILKEKLEEQDKKIVYLKKQLNNAKKSGGGGGGSGDGSGSGSGSGAGGEGGNVLPVMDDDYKVDSTGLAPAGRAPGKNGGPVPPVPLAGMPGSLDQAPVKVTPALLEKLKKQAAASKKAGKSPMSMVAAGAAAAAAKGGKKDVFGDLKGFLGRHAESTKSNPTADANRKEDLAVKKKADQAAKALAKKYPEKKPIYPNVKMRNIFWTKVPTNQLDGTVWEKLSDKSIKTEPKQLEAQFGKDAAGPQGKALSRANTMERKAKQEVHLCDSKRQQNIGIALSRFRISDEDLRVAILGMDETLLTLERAKALEQLAPTPEELELCNNYLQQHGDKGVNKLCREDRFLVEMSKIPRMQQRMKCVVTKLSLDNDVSALREKMAIIREACVEVENSKEVRRLLEVVLAVGNHCNGGTPRGQAYGFKLDALQKLETVKANGGKHTLMHFLVQLLELHYPKLLGFRLHKAPKAAEYSLSDLQKELNTVASGMRDIKTELQMEHPDRRDKFPKVMGGFEVRGSKRVQELQQLFDTVRQDFHRVALMFAEKGPKVEPMTFFTRFVRFTQAIIDCKMAIDQQRMRAERQRKLAEEKQRRATLRKMRQMQDQGGGVFEAFAKANAGNASDIVENFLQRYRKSSYANLRNEQTGGRGSIPGPTEEESENELMAILARRKAKDKKRRKKKKKGQSSRSRQQTDFAVA